MDSRKKIGTFVYNGVTFIYDGQQIHGKNAPIIVCPVCKRKRRVSRSIEAQVKNGTTTGKCHSCGAKKPRKKRVRSTGIYKFSTGSIVYLGSVDPNNKSRFLVECGMCHATRYVQISKHMLEHSTGYCRHCAEIAKNKGGKNHPGWKGGVLTDKDGYVCISSTLLSEDDLRIVEPMINNAGYIREHRLVVARSMGRPLSSSEIVHHINGIKDDNRLENLSLKNRSSHSQSHAETIAELTRLKAILHQHGIPF